MLVSPGILWATRERDLWKSFSQIGKSIHYANGFVNTKMYKFSSFRKTSDKNSRENRHNYPLTSQYLALILWALFLVKGGLPGETFSGSGTAV